jgi:hypothetical protein
VEHDLREALGRRTRGLGAATKSVSCKRCGARVEMDPGAFAGKCPFCGSPQVAEAEGEGPLRPESLIPFKVEKQRAETSFSEWVAGLWFRPSDLKRLARLREIRGVYLPYWTFDAHAESDWTADAGYYYYETETYTEQGQTRTRQVRRTRWEPAWGHHADDYDDVLVYASRGLPAAELAGIEPFDTQGGLVPYAPDYIAGFGAEMHALDPMEGWEVAETRIRDTERDACSRMVPGDTQRNLRVTSSLSGQTFKSVMLPAYVAAYEYKDKVYRVLVNGQSGKVDGKAPWSWVKITLAIAAAAAVAITIWQLAQ